MQLREKLKEILKNKSNLTNYLIAQNILIFLDKKTIPTVEEIAEKSHTNKSTVTRFAQKLNFNGWKDFILELSQEEEKYYPNIEKEHFFTNDSFNDFQKEIINDILMLELHKNKISEITKLLKNKKIYLFSSYQTEEPTQNFYENLQILNLDVKWVKGTNKILLSPIVEKNSICFWIISGIDNGQLVNIYNDVSTLKNIINITIGSTSQITKLKNPNYSFPIHVGKTIMRETSKKILLTYILNQFINILIFESKDLLLLLTNPKFKY